MVVTRKSLPPCRRWVRDLVNAGEVTDGSAARAYKEAICLLGGKCAVLGCLVEDHDMLTIAHRSGDGGSHRRQYATHYTINTSGVQRPAPSTGYYQDIRRDIQEGRGDRYILLCANHHKKLDAVSGREKRYATQRGTLR